MQPKEVFARNVRAERKRQNLSQEALADRTDGLSLAQINRVERAVYDPQLLTISRVAHGLAIPVAELLRGV